jgi:predicted nucleic-acid-binding Zn-ribbon protein
MKNLLYCPLCGSTKFTEYENSDYQVTAIYCDHCPYGVEDSTKSIKELRLIHNKRYEYKKNC